MEISNNLLIALCQVRPSLDKQETIQKALNMINEAVAKGCQMVVLPEFWNSPFSHSLFDRYSENIPVVGQNPSEQDNPTIFALCNKAKESSIWIVGGSIPEKDGEKLLNTCVVIDPSGQIIAKHSKLHLFDVDVPGKISFRESDSFNPGRNVTVFNTPWGNVGVGICYDIRFTEYVSILRQRGCRLLIFPGAFGMVTGEAHWEILQRARAIDNQCFVVGCSLARDEDPNAKGYAPWGHSTVVAPWGDIVAKAGAYQELVVANIDFQLAEDMRQSIPCWVQKRSDLYEIIDKSKHDNN